MSDCHECRCFISPPCNACVECQHVDIPDCDNNCRDCEEHNE